MSRTSKRRSTPGTSTPRDSVALAAGSAVNGVLAYVVFSLASHALGAEAAAVSVLWTFWAFTGAAVTFPVQHWITRTVVAHGEGSVRRALPSIVGAVAGLSLVLAGLSALLRTTLFHRSDLVFPVLVGVMTIGSALIGLLRGVLSGRRRFRAVATSLALENLLRSVAALVLLLAGSTQSAAYGAALAAGFLVVLGWPSVFRLGSDADERPTTGPLAFLGRTGTAQFLNQLLLTGGPVALALAHGSEVEVTALFAALSLFRAPYLMALGVLPQVTERVTRLVLRDAGMVRRLVAPLAVGTVVLSGIAAALGAIVGPWLLRLVFGDEVRIAAGPAAIVAAGSVVAVANLALMSMVIAEDRSTTAARAWVTATLAAAVVFVALSGVPPLDQVVWTFLGAQTWACAFLLVRLGRRDRTKAHLSRG